ncbi:MULTISPECIES: CheR family methyltransferase [Kordiimonas]|uniref:CheR family methyltransferase n=1 Tax=Kordiimonas TaxID=288021 RepID=UPI001FF41D27|nr:protein-glutamate O-methyltransferase CheR [Kordiimonas sp. SCSIO 12603]MCK0068741.1 protein-glutamate O-methyltransferase CheR [Kordiimonas laminariae]UTW58097.1 protein-glutamate O-methyltransferase CheR [Kordiimonas sp. SCSIO 12603]
MNTADFDFLAGTLKERSGLMLTPDKVYLLESRLTPLARKRGLDTLDALVQKLRMKTDQTLLKDVTEAMTTNESFFFRDNTPFDLFKNHVLPAMEKARGTQKRLRIWCAAASTGQEPYSLAILLKEAGIKYSNWNIEIVGTDICTQVLEKAKAGKYSQFEVQRGLPIQLLIKYFTQEGDVWQLSDDIRNMVKFRPFNLLDNFAALGTFDVIYCRNVLIYFDQKTKGQVLDRMRKVLASDGTLFLGAAETVLGITDSFKPVKGQRGMYVPSDGTAEQLMGLG